MSRMSHKKNCFVQNTKSAPLGSPAQDYLSGKAPSLWWGLQRTAWSLPSTFLVERLLQLGPMTEVSNGVSVSQNMDRTVYHSPFFLSDMEQGQLLRRVSLGNPDEARVGERSVAALLQHGSGPIFSFWPFFSFLSFSKYCIIHMFLGPT